MHLWHGVVSTGAKRPAPQQPSRDQNCTPTHPMNLNRLLGISRTTREKPAWRKSVGESLLIPSNRPQHQFFHQKPPIFSPFEHIARVTNRPLCPVRRKRVGSHPRRRRPDKTPAKSAAIWRETTRATDGARGFVARPPRPADPGHRRWRLGSSLGRATCCTKEFPSEHMCPRSVGGGRSVASEYD